MKTESDAVNSHVFIVAEAGSNWRAGGPRAGTTDLERALRLIDVAADAGADACKFQFWSDARQVYAPNAGVLGYLAAKGETRSINDVFADLQLPTEWLPGLAARCEVRRIEFMASVFDPEDVPIVDPFVRRHKIASYEMGYEALVRAAAATGRPLIVSTGAHNWSEVTQAVDWARAAGCADLTLLYCCAAYPAPDEALELRALTHHHTVKTGYSDHSPDWWTPVVATALGATVIEKHFTLSRRLAGPDHAFALEPHELGMMVNAIRRTEIMCGDGRKRIMPAEEPLRRFAVRQVVALRDIEPGERLHAGKNIGVLRPGNRPEGEWAGQLGKVNGRLAACGFVCGDGIRLVDTKSGVRAGKDKQ